MSADPAQLSDSQLDDQFRALLEGLRTTLPGVQVLFAFLLTLPLLQAFEGLTDAERIAFGVAFYGSAIASILLIAPSVHQRMRAPITGIPRQDPPHVRVAVVLAIVGTVSFIIALVASVYLISSVILEGPPLAAMVTAGVGAIAAWSWFYLPLVHFRR